MAMYFPWALVLLDFQIIQGLNKAHDFNPPVCAGLSLLDK